MFTEQQKNLLKNAAGPIPGDHYEGEDTSAIDAAIVTIKAASPRAFHTNDTLAARKFFNEPRSRTPSAGCVHKADDGILSAWAADESIAITQAVRKAMRNKGLS